MLLFGALMVCTLAGLGIACAAQAQPAFAEQRHQVLTSPAGGGTPTTNLNHTKTPTNTFTSTPTITPTPSVTATSTPTPTDTLFTRTPTPTCCNNVTGSAYAGCGGGNRGLEIDYTLGNSCDLPVVGSGSVSLEVRRASDGVWVVYYDYWSWNNYSFHTGSNHEWWSENNWPLPPEYDAIRAHLHVTGECWEVDFVSESVSGYSCYRGTATSTATPTNIPTNTPVPTNTNTPIPAVINGHLTWQGVSPANRPLVTGTLALCVSGSQQTFGTFNTDTNSFFTLTTGLPDGVYHWYIKGGRHLSNSAPDDGGDLIISGGQATQEFGTQKGGNTDTNNIVNASDFGNLKVMFGGSGVRSADFDYNQVINITDFNILKLTFGQSGHTLACP